MLKPEYDREVKILRNNLELARRSVVINSQRLVRAGLDAIERQVAQQEALAKVFTLIGRADEEAKRTGDDAAGLSPEASK